MICYIENNKACVQCDFHQKEIVKAVGGYEKWDKTAKVWRFPLNKLPIICGNLPVAYGADVEQELKHLKKAYEERKQALYLADRIKRKEYNQPPGGRMMYHQKQALSLLQLFDSYALFMELGCVDCNTEYLSPTGWKRIDKYDSGKIAQYNLETQKAEFVQPSEYIKLPNGLHQMYRFKTSTDLDQLLSPEHRVLSFQAGNNKPYILSAKEFYERHQKNKNGCKLRVLTAFELETNEKINLTDNLLRLQIAAMADGHFPNKSNSCIVRLKKKHKIDRLKILLEKANTPFKTHLEVDGLLTFSFKAPIRTKYFTQDFWRASFHQRKIICDEVQYWDASIEKNNRGVRFFCHNQFDADFIQYCFASTGKKASINSVDRGYKNRSYTVGVIGTGRSKNFVHISTKKENVTLTQPSDDYKYCFEVPSTFLILRRNNSIFVTGNTGKSLVAIKRAEILQCKTLVIAPLSTLESVWVEEIKKWSTLRYINLWKHIKKKGYSIPDGYDMYLINYESVKKIKIEQIVKADIKLMILDESAKTKDNKSQISKYCIELSQSIPYRVILSGLPAPNSILEYHSQMAIVNPDLLGFNYYRFRNTWFYSTGYGGYLYKCNEENRLKIMKKISEQAFFVKKDDVLDLPEKVYEFRTYEMEDKQLQAYKNMKKENILAFKNRIILAANELAKLMKLRQVTAGFCISNEGMPVKISDAKFNLLKETLAEVPKDKQVIIWVQFHFEIKAIKKILKDEATTLYGEMPQKDKEFAIQEFKSGEYKYLIAHPKSGGVGLTFNNCSYMIWFSLSYSHEEHAQANGRIYRKGQKNKCTYIYLLAEKSIDEIIFHALKRKEVVAKVCLEMLKGEE